MRHVHCQQVAVVHVLHFCCSRRHNTTCGHAALGIVLDANITPEHLPAGARAQPH